MAKNLVQMSVNGVLYDIRDQRMTTKLEFQYDRIHKCSTQLNYVEMLQDIYNYKSRDKINLVEIR